MPDKENQILVFDFYARYKIIDAVQFEKTLGSETNARSRVGGLVTSTLRDQVALRNRFEIIGSLPVLDANGNQVLDEDGLPFVEGTNRRSELMGQVLGSVRERAAQENFGIEFIDVRIKRVSFPNSVVPTIFVRMRAERARIAMLFRNEGQVEAAGIRAETDKQKAIILAEAQREANAITAEGEARAIEIFIQALAQVPELSRYQKSLEAYKVSGTKRR